MVQLLNSECWRVGVGSFTKDWNVPFSPNISGAFWEYIHLLRGKTTQLPTSLCKNDCWIPAGQKSVLYFLQNTPTFLYILKHLFSQFFPYLLNVWVEFWKLWFIPCLWKTVLCRTSSLGTTAVNECTDFLTGLIDLLVQLVIIWLPITLDSHYHSIRAILSIFNCLSCLLRYIQYTQQLLFYLVMEIVCYATKF